MKRFILVVSVLALSILACRAEGIKHMLSPGRISSDFLMTGTNSEFRNASYDVYGTTTSGGTKYFEFTPTAFSWDTANSTLTTAGHLALSDGLRVGSNSTFRGAINDFAPAGTIYIRTYMANSQGMLALTTSANRSLVIKDGDSYSSNPDHALQNTPTLFIHSDTNPDTDNTQWVSLAHNETDAVIGVGKGSLIWTSQNSTMTTSGNFSSNGTGAFTGADNGTAFTIKISTTQASLTAADTFIDFRSDTGSEGNVSGTAVAGIIAYNTFTGSHWTSVEGSQIEPGQVLEMTGGVMPKNAGNGSIAYLAKSRICSREGTNKVYGVYGGKDKDGHDLAIGLGTYPVLVSNKNGDIAAGDLLECDGEGYAQKSNTALITSATLGKAVEGVNWEKRKAKIIKRIGVILYAG